MSITARDIQKAWAILEQWRTRARALKKDTKDLDHIIRVLNQLTGEGK